MASSPRLKVYRGDEYVASVKYAEDAAAIIASGGEDMTIRDGHKHVVWTEGQEAQSAAESYDFVALTIYGRMAK